MLPLKQYSIFHERMRDRSHSGWQRFLVAILSGIIFERLDRLDLFQFRREFLSNPQVQKPIELFTYRQTDRHNHLIFFWSASNFLFRLHPSSVFLSLFFSVSLVCPKQQRLSLIEWLDRINRINWKLGSYTHTDRQIRENEEEEGNYKLGSVRPKMRLQS